MNSLLRTKFMNEGITPQEFANLATEEKWCTLIPEKGGLKVGDIVTFTNEFGVSFPNKEIVGISEEEFYERCVYLNKDAFWFPVKISELTKQCS